MQHLAYHDVLTGLPNRAMFQDHLELALARSRRHGLAVAVLFLDLDDFKPINDTHGHDVGDEVLQGAATRIRSAVRDTDLVARQGGDEFLVLLADLDIAADEHTAAGVVQEASERIAKAIAEPIVVGRRHSVDPREHRGCRLSVPCRRCSFVASSG